MKTSRFSETQNFTILKQAERGLKVKDLCREHGISDATYYNWKAKYGGLEASDLKRSGAFLLLRPPGGTAEGHERGGDARWIWDSMGSHP